MQMKTKLKLPLRSMAVLGFVACVSCGLGVTDYAVADWHSGHHGGSAHGSFSEQDYEKSSDIAEAAAFVALFGTGRKEWLCGINEFSSGDTAEKLRNNLELLALYVFEQSSRQDGSIDASIAGFNVKFTQFRLPTLDWRKEGCAFKDKRLSCDAPDGVIQYVRNFATPTGIVYLYIENTYGVDAPAASALTRKSKSNPDRGVGSVYNCIPSPLSL